MNFISPNTLAGLMSTVSISHSRPEKPFNTNQCAAYQLSMRVVFVPQIIEDYKRLAGVSTIHQLFNDEQSAHRILSLSDRAYLLAFHALTVKTLNLNEGLTNWKNMDDPAVRMSCDQSFITKIEQQYFHQYCKNITSGVAKISTEYFSKEGSSINYVVLSPGVMVTQFEPGQAPPINELLSSTCADHLRVLRECLKPFNSNNTKESIAMCDPEGTYSAYLALLPVV